MGSLTKVIKKAKGSQRYTGIEPPGAKKPKMQTAPRRPPSGGIGPVKSPLGPQ